MNPLTPRLAPEVRDHLTAAEQRLVAAANEYSLAASAAIMAVPKLPLSTDRDAIAEITAYVTAVRRMFPEP
jgi:hypothetical protein